MSIATELSPRVAIIGGGPSALFVLKQFAEHRRPRGSISIFERKNALGQGMPYSVEGASIEHITNVSSQELPSLKDDLSRWLRELPEQSLEKYGLRRGSIDRETIVPRLLFGEYLQHQFSQFLSQAQSRGLRVEVKRNTEIVDISGHQGQRQMQITTSQGKVENFDRVIVCTGHNWPKRLEGKVSNYFDSPYPPQKLNRVFNGAVALRGSSLTAIDAIRTIARANGEFVRRADGTVGFSPSTESPGFEIVMHTLNGLLPCVRIHLDEPEVSEEGLVSQDEWECHRSENQGFVSLDYLFEYDFKKVLEKKDLEFYHSIKDLSLEAFVEYALSSRAGIDPFLQFKGEYEEAKLSRKNRKTVPWKEALATLSFALNHPAKYFSAEDYQRLQKALSPLIAVVIAFVPEASCEELLALHEAGRLKLVQVDETSQVEVERDGPIIYRYGTDRNAQSENFLAYVDCVGQPRLNLQDFPFRSLKRDKIVSQAYLAFQSAEKGREALENDPSTVRRDEQGRYHLLVPGLAINDCFQPLLKSGQAEPRLHIMAVPYIGGHNPDYSGVDFCEKASKLIVNSILSEAV